jgi:hypothetical protein
VAARENRAFLHRAVRFLAGEAGIRQLLDIGTGLPTAGSVYEIAHACAAREPRVVYADYGPVVVRHAEALLADSLHVAVVRADLRRPRDLLAQPTVRTMIDLAQPVAVLLIAVLHFVPDSEDPWAIVNQIKDQMAPGSYLVISHVTADHITPGAARGARDAYAGASARGGGAHAGAGCSILRRAGHGQPGPGERVRVAARRDRPGCGPGPVLRRNRA